MSDDGRSDREAPGVPQAAGTPFGNFRRRTLETFASLIFGTVVAGLYAILTARALGPSGKGLVTILLLLPALATLVLSGPIELANQYFGAREPETRHGLLTNSLVVSGIGGIAAALVLLLVGAVGTRFGGTWLELVLTVATIPLVAASRLIAGLILSTGRTLTYNLLTPLGPTLLLVFTAGAFLVWGSSALTVVSANAAAQVLVFLATMGVAGIPPGRPSARLLRDCVRYGVFGFSANLVQFLNFRLDFFLLSALRSSASVGIYSIATTLAELVGRIASSAATILLPRVAAGAPGGVAFTTRVARVVVLVTIAAALALAAVGSFLITLFFGDSFSGAYTPLLVLLPGMAALALATVLATDLAGRGAPAVLLYGSLIGLVLTCVLNPILIPLYGATGAALTSTVAYTASTAFVAVVFGRRHGTRLSDVLVPRRGDFRARAAVGPPA